MINTRSVEKVFSALIAIFTCGFGTVTGTTHRSMCYGNYTRSMNGFKLVSYYEFYRDFHKVLPSLETDKNNIGSFFDKDRYTNLLLFKSPNNYIHASIYIINGYGYILTNYGAIRARWMLRKLSKRMLLPLDEQRRRKIDQLI